MAATATNALLLARLHALGVDTLPSPFYLPETEERYAVLEQLADRLMSAAGVGTSERAASGGGDRAAAICSALGGVGLPVTLQLIQGTGDRASDERLLSDIADVCEELQRSDMQQQQTEDNAGATARVKTGGASANAAAAKGSVHLSQMLQAAAAHVSTSAAAGDGLFKGAPELARVYKEGAANRGEAMGELQRRLALLRGELAAVTAELDAIPQVEAGSDQEHAAAAARVASELRGLLAAAASLRAVFESELKPWAAAAVARASDGNSSSSSSNDNNGQQQRLQRCDASDAGGALAAQERLSGVLRALGELRAAHAALRARGDDLADPQGEIPSLAEEMRASVEALQREADLAAGCAAGDGLSLAAAADPGFTAAWFASCGGGGGGMRAAVATPGAV